MIDLGFYSLEIPAAIGTASVLAGEERRHIRTEIPAGCPVRLLFVSWIRREPGLTERLEPSEQAEMAHGLRSERAIMCRLLTAHDSFF